MGMAFSSEKEVTFAYAVYRYIEWEDYPEKKDKAHKILISQTFPPPPEFQLGPIPGTNPVLEGRACITELSLNRVDTARQA
jgi:hypothetical protein